MCPLNTVLNVFRTDCSIQNAVVWRTRVELLEVVTHYVSNKIHSFSVKICFCVRLITHRNFPLFQALKTGEIGVHFAVTSDSHMNYIDMKEYDSDAQYSAVHKMSSSEADSLTNHRRIYSCDVCQNVFSHERELKKHLLVHSGMCLYSCNICNKVFRHRGNLKQHERVHSGERPYSCDVCEKAFSQHSGLKRHLRVHTGQRPYSCHICKKAFNVHDNLKQHQRVHTGERPYVCSICTKAFSMHDNLKQHQRVHTGERPYSCDVCMKAFRQRAHLKKHQLVHTGGRP